MPAPFQAAAEWVSGRLQLNFLSDPPDKTNLLTIEKDIVLDSATARALGYEQVTVHAGQYPVDYAVNPNGQVSPEVTARGIDHYDPCWPSERRLHGIRFLRHYD